MHMIMEFLKGTLQFLISVWIITLLVKYFLRRTLLGKIISLFCESIWRTLKFSYMQFKRLGQIAYADTKKYYKYINELSSKKQQKKVVNESNNVVNFKTAKNQYKKKHK